MNYFKHPSALIETENIGDNTRVWAFSHILPGAQIGADCNICDHVFIENDVIVGDRVTIKCGVQLWDGLRIEDDVFIGPNATFSNDLFPRSKQRPGTFVKTLICKGASIGANATILAGNTIGDSAMVGAGSVVTRSIPPNAIVMGNPAQITGYVSATKMSLVEPDIKPDIASRNAPVSNITGAGMYQLPIINDMRGSLSFAEMGKSLPFLPKRYFLVFDVPSREVRGEHAHRNLHQFLVCIRGTCTVMLDDGARREEYILASPATGMHIPPLVWSVQYKYSSDAVLLVLASDIYDPADYIRDYSEFLALVRGK